MYNYKNNLHNYSNLQSEKYMCISFSNATGHWDIGIYYCLYIFFLQKAIQQRMLGESSLTHDEESEEFNANQPQTTTEVSTD